MFDSETRWFIRCDTCPDPYVMHTRDYGTSDKRDASGHAVAMGWEIHDDRHRCPDCIYVGRTEIAS